MFWAQAYIAVRAQKSVRLCRVDGSREPGSCNRDHGSILPRVPLARRHIRCAERSHTAGLQRSLSASCVSLGRFGLQAEFHIEPDQETWSAWRGHLPDGLLKGRDLKRHLIAQCGKEVFRNFFEVASGEESERTAGPQKLGPLPPACHVVFDCVLPVELGLLSQHRAVRPR